MERGNDQVNSDSSNLQIFSEVEGKIVVDTNKASLLAEEGGKFIFKPEAEDALISVLLLKEFVDDLYEQVKEQIASAGTSISDNFRGVIGDKVRCNYRAFGAKYEYTNKEQANPFLKHKEYWSVDSGLVDEYIDKVGEMPDGVKLKDRKNQISISYKPEDVRQLLDE